MTDNTVGKALKSLPTFVWTGCIFFSATVAQLIIERVADFYVPVGREGTAFGTAWRLIVTICEWVPPWFLLGIGVGALLVGLLDNRYRLYRLVGGRSPLQLKMEGANIFELEGANLTGVLVDAIVWSRGVPTSVIKWSLLVVCNNEEVSTHVQAIPRQLHLKGPKGSIVVENSSCVIQKSLTSKVGDIPIRGHAYFLTEIDRAAIVKSDTIFKLSIEDANGRTAETEKKVGDWLSSDKLLSENGKASNKTLQS